MDSRIIELFLKYINEQCTLDELEEVLLILKQGTYSSEWALAISEDEAHVVKNDKVSNLTNQEIEDLYDGIKSGIKKPIPFWYKISVAAAIVAIVSGLFLFYNHNYGVDQLSKDVVKNKIKPGKNTAVLTLANGKTINLSDAKSGVVINVSNLTYSDGSTVVQEADGKTVFGTTSTHELLTAATPRGGTYQIVLPDGSKVWLNAASSLKFPATFSQKLNREVELNGEAYFEIAKDKNHPFKVKTIQQEVEVLGTHFNVNAYADEGIVKTTLLEGKVKLNHKNAAAILKPGQQGYIADGLLDFKVVEADAANISAWKNGEFIFNNTDLKSLMRQISRWYDVDVVYEAGVKNDVFFGKIKRNADLSKVLKILALGDIHFRIEGRKLIVMK